MGNYRYMLWAGLEFRVWKHSGQRYNCYGNKKNIEGTACVKHEIRL